MKKGLGFHIKKFGKNDKATTSQTFVGKPLRSSVRNRLWIAILGFVVLCSGCVSNSERKQFLNGFYVVGWVGEPGSYTVTSELSTNDLLKMAKGINEMASDWKLRAVYSEKTGGERIIVDRARWDVPIKDLGIDLSIHRVLEVQGIKNW